MKLKCQRSSELLNWTFRFGACSRLCWQRVRVCTEVKTGQKWKTPKMQLLRRAEVNSSEHCKAGTTTGKAWAQNSPVCSGTLGRALPCRWHKRVGPRQLPVWQPTQKMERNTCFFQCFAIFASLLKILAPADSSLMASGNTVVGGRSLSLDKQRFSGDYEHLTQLNLALI